MRFDLIALDPNYGCRVNARPFRKLYLREKSAGPYLSELFSDVDHSGHCSALFCSYDDGKSRIPNYPYKIHLTSIKLQVTCYNLGVG